MGNNQRSGTLTNRVDGFLDLLLCLSIEGGCGLVEQHDWCLFQQSAGNSNSLFFTTGQLQASLADFAIITKIGLHEQWMNRASFGGWYDHLDQFILLGSVINHCGDNRVVQSSIGNIVKNRIIE